MAESVGNVCPLAFGSEQMPNDKLCIGAECKWFIVESEEGELLLGDCAVPIIAQILLERDED